MSAGSSHLERKFESLRDTISLPSFLARGRHSKRTTASPYDKSSNYKSRIDKVVHASAEKKSAATAMTSSSSNSTSLIFLIPEITEQILLGVPAIDVQTTCRCVCKAWKDLIETSSPALRYYATTGLRLSTLQSHKSTDADCADAKYPPEACLLDAHGNLEVELGGLEDDYYDLTLDIDLDPLLHLDQPPPHITPLAVQVISMFWKKLVRNALITTEHDNFIFPRRDSVGNDRDVDCLDLFLCPFTLFWYFVRLPFKWTLPLIRPLERDRRRVVTTAEKLCKQFAPITRKIAFAPPGSLDKISVDVEMRTNWTALPYRKKSRRRTLIGNPYGMPAPYFHVMAELTRVVFDDTPIPLSYSSGPGGHAVVLVDLDYRFRTRVVARERLALESYEPYDVEVGDRERQYFGIYTSS
ncbi:hypothetical protein TWF696_005921 [Orbilia brochopaga]|uniref:F-box domain-containing protein n=1 Tax=Orbilia brochopaga TaxID=3140254 RepID=A0AAV9UX32_9PEZI